MAAHAASRTLAQAEKAAFLFACAARRPHLHQAEGIAHHRGKLAYGLHRGISCAPSRINGSAR